MTDRVGPGAHLLITGGAGFIGSELVRQVMGRRDGTRVTVLDKLTYAGNRANLATVEDDPEQAARFAFVHGDIADPEVVGPLVAAADAVLNVAAETHVDRSILDPEAFLRTGVIGVHVLLEAVRREAERVRTGERATNPRFLQVSTDEVYGDIPAGHSTETDALAPRSPYAAAKAASELLVRAYQVTGARLLPNREVIARLLEATGRDWSLVRTVPDRPGHDRRYAMDGSRLAALGWRPVVDFEQGLPETVAWYRANPAWVASARSGDWDSYYQRQYGDRLAAGRAVEPQDRAG
jgi:dTDP-D-glucose 4,6-dehydratase